MPIRSYLRALPTSALVIVMSMQAAGAQSLEPARAAAALDAFFTKSDFQKVVATRSNDDGMTAFFTVIRGTGAEETNGSASFVQMDDGQWYLMLVSTSWNLWNNLLRPVD